MEGSTAGSDPAVVSPVNTFRALALQHMAQADLDEGDDDDSVPTFRPVTIAQLFDFETTLWAESYSRHAGYSFDEELSLYELLDLDAEGEADGGEDEVDESMEDILIG